MERSCRSLSKNIYELFHIILIRLLLSEGKFEIHLSLHKCRFALRSPRIQTVAVASTGPRNTANVFSGMSSSGVEYSLSCRPFSAIERILYEFTDKIPTVSLYHLESQRISQVFRTIYVYLVCQLNLVSGFYMLDFVAVCTRVPLSAIFILIL